MDTFFNSEDFPYLRPLKENFHDILAEYNSATFSPAPFPYVNIYNEGWYVYGLKYKDVQISSICARFPKTWSVIQSVDAHIYTCGFSILKPGCEITPHDGSADSVEGILRGHLCLKTNPDCALTVGGITKSWVEGELLIFDDFTEHSAYNRGTTDRVALLFDFYRK